MRFAKHLTLASVLIFASLLLSGCVSSVWLSPKSATLPIRGMKHVVAKYKLQGDSDTIYVMADKNLRWRSRNTAVATVSSGGVITGRHAGSTKVIVTYNDGAGTVHSSYVSVTVKDYKVRSITLSKTRALMNKGSYMRIGKTVLPTYATTRSVTWISSNTRVARVSTTGVVSALAVGTTRITATANDGSGVKASCYVTVGILPTSISFNMSNVSLASLEQTRVVATLLPTNSTQRGIVWTTSDSQVATVSATGVVGVTEGASVGQTCTITGKTINGRTATCVVTVIERPRRLSESGNYYLLKRSEYAYLPRCTVDRWQPHI